MRFRCRKCDQEHDLEDGIGFGIDHPAQWDVVSDAERAPPPARSTIFDDVFAEVPAHLEAQKAQKVAEAAVPAVKESSP